MKNFFTLVFGCIFSTISWSQCGGGIPSAGNPGCIPPDRSNSPYYQGDDDYHPAPKIIYEDRFGAIASDADLEKFGTVTSKNSQSDAEQKALLECKKNGGEDCIIKLWYANGCAVITQGDETYSFTRGKNINEAEKNGLNRCRAKSTPSSCKKIYEGCSPAVRVQ